LKGGIMLAQLIARGKSRIKANPAMGIYGAMLAADAPERTIDRTQALECVYTTASHFHYETRQFATAADCAAWIAESPYTRMYE